MLIQRGSFIILSRDVAIRVMSLTDEVILEYISLTNSQSLNTRFYLATQNFFLFYWYFGLESNWFREYII